MKANEVPSVESFGFSLTLQLRSDEVGQKNGNFGQKTVIFAEINGFG